MSRHTAPGFSVDLSDAARIAGRRVRGLGVVVPIDFKVKEGSENKLMDWYNSRSSRLVHAIQLRREREAPYFHQFIVFELRDKCGLFRIDRRLRPDEHSPLDSLKDEGIPAFDTIEPVGSWDDPLFPASDCLISIEFKVDVHLALILKICRAIQAHPLAHVYTLQRYNCYFFAQTILLCVACGVSNWAGTGDWLLEYKFNISQVEQQLMKSTPNSDKGFGSLSRSKDNQKACLGTRTVPNATKFLYKGYTFTLEVTTPKPSLLELQRRDIRELYMAKFTPSWKMDHVNFLHDAINSAIQRLLETHLKTERANALFATYQYLMTRSIWEIPISNSFFAFWPKLNEIVIEIRTMRENRSDPLPTSALVFSRPHRESNDSFLEGETRYLRDKSSHQFGAQCFYMVVLGRGAEPYLGWLLYRWIHQSHSESGSLFMISLRNYAQRQLRLCSDRVNRKFTDTCLNSFKQNMTIQINYTTTNVPQEPASDFGLESLPRHRHAQSSVFRWRRTDQKPEKEMTAVTIFEMQKCLDHLISIHSIRVEEYKWATKANAVDVATDIRRVMNEIWGKLIE